MITIKVPGIEAPGFTAMGVGAGLDIPTSRELAAIATGNPGGMTVLINLWKSGPEGQFLAGALADNQWTGEEIWVGYKYLCDQDLSKFGARLKGDLDGFHKKVTAWIGGER